MKTKRITLALLAAYKRWLSPHFLSSCRYVPTCSEYAMEAVERHGAFAGLALAAARLLRCHPLARGGFDPVPADSHPHLQSPALQSATFKSAPTTLPYPSHGRK